ncbi:hypothetical protein NCC78_30465, partial [Micromonospora phytophila]|nr:hypothetical protein [Micromonospora phytophila]
MEATGVYGWTDPIDPDSTPRRPEQPLGDEPPAWLTERPEPKSAYLFGDDPDQPADEWHRDQPTARWQPEPAAEPTGRWQPEDVDPGEHRQPWTGTGETHRADPYQTDRPGDERSFPLAATP